MARRILAWLFLLVTLSFNVIKKNEIWEEFMVERRKGAGSSLAGAGWRGRAGRAAANRVVDDVGSNRSSDIADSDKLGEVVTGSNSSGRPPPARSILAVGERHSRAAHSSPLAATNMVGFILLTKYIVAISSSSRNNNHQSIEQTIKKIRNTDILCWYASMQSLSECLNFYLKLRVLLILSTHQPGAEFL
jgi:hypothetical protein